MYIHLVEWAIALHGMYNSALFFKHNSMCCDIRDIIASFLPHELKYNYEKYICNFGH